MAKGVPVDLELKRAFGELQEKMIETSKKIQSIDAQISMYKRHLELAEASDREISTLPPETKMYESVARMFLLTDLKEYIINANAREAQLRARTAELQNSKNYLEKNLKESTNNLREMVQHRKEQNEVEGQKGKLN